MDAKEYLDKYIGILILVTLVGATGASLLAALVALNGTFASTGLGLLFGAGIIGVLFCVWIFYMVYKHFSN